MDNEIKGVERDIVIIVRKSHARFIRGQGEVGLYPAFQMTRQDRVGFNLALIGPDFKVLRSVVFDPRDMSVFYRQGDERAVEGYSWAKHLPGRERTFDEDVGAK